MLSHRSSVTPYHWAIVVLFGAIQLAIAADVPLSRFPVFTQATYWVGNCASTASKLFSTSFGCPSQDPARCLCTDASKSSRVVSGIRSCASYYVADKGVTDLSTATQLWASYCQTNAGVSARDESQLEDVPMYTRVTNMITICATSWTDRFISTFGCDAYTKAPCLCQSVSSDQLLDSIVRCASGVVNDNRNDASASQLFKSYCDMNFNAPASRTVGAPVNVAAIPTSGSTLRTVSSQTAATGPADRNNQPTETGTGDSSSTTGSSGNTERKVPWEAIGAVAGVIGVVVAIIVGWRTCFRGTIGS